MKPQFLAIPAIITMACAARGDPLIMVCMRFLASLIALLLFTCDNILAIRMPYMAALCLGSTYCGKWELFIPELIPWALPVAGGLVFHLIFYRHRVRVGASLPGLIATSVAVLFSGLGADGERLDGITALYYLFGLSIGAILFYLVFAANIGGGDHFDPTVHFLWCSFLTGLIGVVILLRAYFTWLSSEERIAIIRFFVTMIPYSNSIGNILISTLPAPFYFMRKRSFPVAVKFLFFLGGLAIYAALLLTGSRSAWLAGSLLFLCCLLYFFCARGNRIFKWVCFGCLLTAAVILYVRFYDSIHSLLSSTFNKGFASKTESRFLLIFRSVSDFLAHPVFGIGILSLNNSDLYGIGTGCMCWYHMYFPQIIGSMGSVGILAYGYQLFLRARLIFTRPHRESLALALSYLGIFFFSMTDPGEFMPIPFLETAVLIFALLENEVGKSESLEHFSHRIFKRNRSSD